MNEKNYGASRWRGTNLKKVIIIIIFVALLGIRVYILWGFDENSELIDIAIKYGSNK